MVEITDREINMIHDTYKIVVKMDTVLGNGGAGLCEDVRCHQKRLSRLELVIAGLVGSGALTGGVIGLVKWLSG